MSQGSYKKPMETELLAQNSTGTQSELHSVVTGC